MSLSLSKRAVALGAAALALLGAGVGGGIALAAADTIRAPYAQAAAVVTADGTLFKSKGIDSVTTVGVNSFCVKLADPKADVSKLIYTVTSTSHAYRATASQAPVASCGNAKNVIHVHTMAEYEYGGGLTRSPFTLVVH
ncbi:hypothetical protein [Streptomyces omiyaensis]|uniref:hypothetical protein n=1 Tax=Streptomyces omiyaensis TaxID=68247 RepID=UPI0036F9B8D8